VHALQPLVCPIVLRVANSVTAGLDEKQVKDRILNVIKSFQGVDAQKVTETSNFQKDLGLDSLSVVEV